MEEAWRKEINGMNGIKEERESSMVRYPNPRAIEIDLINANNLLDKVVSRVEDKVTLPLNSSKEIRQEILQIEIY